MRSYPQFTMRDILYTLPMIQGFALRAAAISIDPMCEVEVRDGYIWQETQNRLTR